MNHSHVVDGVSIRELTSNGRHLPDRHRLVALIFKKSRTPPIAMIPDYAFKGDYGAISAVEQGVDQPARIDRMAGQRKLISALRDLFNKRGRSPAHRWKECDFVAVARRGLKLGKFAVSRQHNAAGKLTNPRHASGIMIEYIGQTRALANLELILGYAHQVL